jgi:lysozyme
VDVSIPMFRLAKRGGDGLCCDARGVGLGPVALVEAAQANGRRVYRRRPAEEIARTLALAYDPFSSDDLAHRLSGLDVAARALEAGDMAKAAVATVLLKLPPLSAEAAAKLAREPTLKKYSPDQPRDERGRWTGGGGAAEANADDAASTRPVQVAADGTGVISDAGGILPAADKPTTRRPAQLLSTSDAGVSFLLRQETFSPTVYKDDAGNPTIGYGHKLKPGESFPNGITEEQARQLLCADLAEGERAVRQNVKVNLTQSQFDALIAFTYNVGSGTRGFRGSTLLRQLNAGNFAAAANQFPRWNKDKKKINGRERLVVSPGLTRRRNAERSLFVNGAYE